MTSGRKTFFLLLLIAFLVSMPPAIVLAQPAQQEEEAAPDIRDRIAAFLAQFVGDDAAVEEVESSAEDEPLIDLGREIVTGTIAIAAVIIAIYLIVRGNQPPGKRDPFRSRW